MEGFLSLPRSAKGGLAVILAVALLGWAIVAYSAKRQHEDARSLENAVATLKSQEDRQAAVLSERENLEERLAAAEAELTTSREALAASRQEKTDIETEFAELEAELVSAREQVAHESSESAAGEGSALALLDTRDDGDATDAETAADQNDAETLRANLTKTMTSLSAKTAMLQQRDRDLSRALERVEAADAEIQSLAADAEKQEVMRERLTGMMTTLSAERAMLQQRERELEALKEEREAAEAKIAALETTIAESEEANRSGDALAARLDRTKQALDESDEALRRSEAALAERQASLKELEDRQASVDAAIEEKQDEIGRREKKLVELGDSLGRQEEQLASTRQEIDTAKTELAEIILAREEGAIESSSLTAEVDSLQAALNEKEDAIAYAESELERLEETIDVAERRLAETEAELEENRSLLNAQDVEIQGVEASLAALKTDRANAEAENVKIKTVVNRQRALVEDLDAVKVKLDATRAELASQTALLDEKRVQVAEANASFERTRQGVQEESEVRQTLPRVPIAALGQGDLAVLPIDPLDKPFPVQTEEGIRLALVHFDLGSAELTPGGLRRAKEAAAWIKKQDVEKIRLVGATDTVGTRKDNLALAERRAQTLFDAFAAEGIDPERIELISMGEAGGGEVIDDQTAEPLNRCVGVFIGEG